MTNTSHKYYFLIPGLGTKWHCGGLQVFSRWAELVPNQIAELVSYRDRIPNVTFLDDVLKEEPLTAVFVIFWGPHLRELDTRLARYKVVACSFSYSRKIRIREDRPILCLSSYTMARWAERGHRGPMFEVPPVLENCYCESGNKRQTEILIFTRKSSSYLRNSLLPRLSSEFSVAIVDRYIADLSPIYRDSKVLIYDSHDHFRFRGVSEGFGLHPLEALASGCKVLSNMDGGLAEYLSRSGNALSIIPFDTEENVRRIRLLLSGPSKEEIDFERFRVEQVKARLLSALQEADRYCQSGGSASSSMVTFKKIRAYSAESFSWFCRLLRPGT